MKYEELRKQGTRGNLGLAHCSNGGVLLTRPEGSAQPSVQIVPSSDAVLIKHHWNHFDDLLDAARKAAEVIDSFPVNCVRNPECTECPHNIEGECISHIIEKTIEQCEEVEGI